MKMLSRIAIAAAAWLPAIAVPVAAQQATGTVTGTVTENAGARPVSGAQVYIPATRQGTQTDDAGAFTLRNVPTGAVTLRVQMIGFEPVERRVAVTAGGTVTVAVTMTRTAVAITGVVVTATGEERKKAIGNAITTIDTTQVVRQAAVNTQQLLAGSTAGVTVFANSGQPGAGGTIRLRGVNTISQGVAPLVYVDGVRVSNANTPTSGQARQFVNPINDIPAEDIDHVDIVKGPAATTLYGTEASGGVIQIFTKHGQEGAQWNVDVTEGFSNMGHVGPKSDPTGLGFNECRGPDLVNGAGVHYLDPTCPASGSWLRDGPIQRYSLGVRGAASGINYFASGNVDDEQGVLPVGGNRDMGLRANLGFSPTKTVTVDLNSSVVHRKVQWYPDGNNAAGAMLNISRGAGSGFKGTGCSTDPTVVCVLNDSLFTLNSSTTTDHFTTGGVITYAPIEKWSNRLAVGYDYNDADNADIRPFGYLITPLGSYDEALWNRQLISADFASTFRQPIGSKFGSTTSIGGQMFDSRLHETDLSSSNFAAPGTPTLITGSARTINAVSEQRVINAGFFGQEMIGWRDLLFVTGGLRVDGNSAFGKSFGLQAYPKISASYVISDERFWPTKWIETLKLRGALGESGKAPGAFDAVRTWLPVAAENGQPAFTPNQVGNPDLGPERTRETELGFDASALDGRIGVTYTYYTDHTFDALIPVQQAPSNGFAGAQLENVGQLFNHGNELSLTGELVRQSDVGLTGQLKYTTLTSRAGDLGGQTITIAALERTYVQQGLPVPAYIGEKVVNANAYADPIIEQNAFLGSVYPTRIISPELTLKLYNRLTFDALGEWQLGGHNLNAVGYQNANSTQQAWQPCYAIQAKMKALATDSTALDNVRAIDRAKCTLSGALRDYSFWVESNDFFKLRSVSVTWDVPPRFLRGVKSGSIVLAGRNLFTSTKYDGSDPEVSDQTDNTFARRDYYVFPTYRTFTLSLRANF